MFLLLFFSLFSSPSQPPTCSPTRLFLISSSLSLTRFISFQLCPQSLDCPFSISVPIVTTLDLFFHLISQEVDQGNQSGRISSLFSHLLYFLLYCLTLTTFFLYSLTFTTFFLFLSSSLLLPFSIFSEALPPSSLVQLSLEQQYSGAEGHCSVPQHPANWKVSLQFSVWSLPYTRSWGSLSIPLLSYILFPCSSFLSSFSIFIRFL